MPVIKLISPHIGNLTSVPVKILNTLTILDFLYPVIAKDVPPKKLNQPHL